MIKIEKNVIVIRVPIKSIKKFAYQGLQDCLEEGQKVDYDILAQDIVGELSAEEEDGSTPIHRLFDEAVEKACENGSQAILD